MSMDTKWFWLRRESTGDTISLPAKNINSVDIDGRAVRIHHFGGEHDQNDTRYLNFDTAAHASAAGHTLIFLVLWAKGLEEGTPMEVIERLPTYLGAGRDAASAWLTKFTEDVKTYFSK